METNKCSGLIGSLLGHNFKPVFDSEETVPPAIDLTAIAERVEDFYVNDALQSAKCTKTTYVKHVCKRCGQIR